MMIRPVLTVLLYVSVCTVSISCRIYNPFGICNEDTVRENSEVTTCRTTDRWGNRIYYDPICEPLTYVTNKTISCRRAYADYLKTFAESAEESPPYPLTLKITDSEIPVLPASTFKHLKNVTIMVLENIKLNKIMPGAFNSLERLQEIYLGQNELTAISDGIFNSLTVLVKIDLSRNRIQTITNDAFVGTVLKTLILSNNNISILGEILVTSLVHLSVLDMSFNNLQNVSNFGNLPTHSLNFSHNTLEFVDFELLPKTSTGFVDISFNRITEVASFNVSNSYEIILSHNRLEYFPTSDYEYTTTRILDISYNNIEMIDTLSAELLKFYVSFNAISSLNSKVFSGLQYLTHLYLDYNNLSSIPNSCFKDLSSLTHLNLSGNELAQFKFGTFDNLKELQVLDISNNNFKELPQYIFHSLSKLTSLSFQNNEVSNINTDDLITHMKMLEEIDLNDNSWSCEKLVNIVHKLKNRNIYFPNGNSWEESNIHGIKCYETFVNTGAENISGLEINLDDSKLNSFFNEDFTKTILYKYFNAGFKESEFFKYLENIRKSDNSSHVENADAVKKLFNELKLTFKDTYGDFRKSEMYNYFNKDFRNSSFFKYLENFTYQRPNISKSEQLAADQLDKMSSYLKNFTKEFENLLKINNSLKFDFEKSEMYNYFNKNFKTTNFFKYLETLNTLPIKEVHSDNINESIADHLISSIKVNEYPIFILYVNAICLVLILVIILITAYRLISRGNKYIFSKKEEVELI